MKAGNRGCHVQVLTHSHGNWPARIYTSWLRVTAAGTGSPRHAHALPAAPASSGSSAPCAPCRQPSAAPEPAACHDARLSVSTATSFSDCSHVPRERVKRDERILRLAAAAEPAVCLHVHSALGRASTFRESPAPSRVAELRPCSRNSAALSAAGLICDRQKAGSCAYSCIAPLAHFRSLQSRGMTYPPHLYAVNYSIDTIFVARAVQQQTMIGS